MPSERRARAIAGEGSEGHHECRQGEQAQERRTSRARGERAIVGEREDQQDRAGHHGESSHYPSRARTESSPDQRCCDHEARSEEELH